MAALLKSPSLLSWPQQQEINALSGRRDILHSRIQRLRPAAHRRVVLEAQLRQLTDRQLKLETELSEGDL